jgi:hypothetical protein
LLAAEEREEGTMEGEITQLRNAAGVVSDLIAAEEGRSHPQQSSPLPISYPSSTPFRRVNSLPGYGSEVGEGEELPAYEDNDGSEMSSVVADGFRYTPGSSDYTPGSENTSETGSMNDILGPDTKS